MKPPVWLVVLVALETTGPMCLNVVIVLVTVGLGVVDKVVTASDGVEGACNGVEGDCNGVEGGSNGAEGTDEDGRRDVLVVVSVQDVVEFKREPDDVGGVTGVSAEEECTESEVLGKIAGTDPEACFVDDKVVVFVRDSVLSLCKLVVSSTQVVEASVVRMRVAVGGSVNDTGSGPTGATLESQDVVAAGGGMM